MFSIQWKDNKGISVVEILAVVAVIAIALTSLLGLASFSLGVSNLLKQTTRANFIAQETVEAVRNFRDGTTWDTDGLGTLTTEVAYYPKKSTDTPPKWQIIQGEEQINGFTRKVVFNNVQRDGSDNIVESGGTNELDTKKITATVSWKERGRAHKVELVTYLTNWKQ